MDKEKVYRVKVKVWDKKLKRWLISAVQYCEDTAHLTAYTNNMSKIPRQKVKFQIDMFIKWGNGKTNPDGFIKMERK